MTRPDNRQTSLDYERVERAIRFIEANFKTQPTLDEIAAAAGLSKYHFDRLFKRWAGISPVQFLQFLTLEYTKERLVESRSLLDTALDAGLSGPSRLHDLFVTFEAMTPGQFKKQAHDVQITYGFAASPFGNCLIATTPRGICHLGFRPDDAQAAAVDELRHAWPGATFTENPRAVRPVAANIFALNPRQDARPFHLLLKGTNFQINVWKALLRIPPGWMVSYQDVAAYIGRPQACRAAAGAIANNPVGYLIPCHRVIAKSGNFHRYGGGATRKKALLGWEAARTHQPLNEELT